MHKTPSSAAPTDQQPSADSFERAAYRSEWKSDVVKLTILILVPCNNLRAQTLKFQRMSRLPAASHQSIRHTSRCCERSQSCFCPHTRRSSGCNEHLTHRPCCVLTGGNLTVPDSGHPSYRLFRGGTVTEFALVFFHSTKPHSSRQASISEGVEPWLADPPIIMIAAANPPRSAPVRPRQTWQHQCVSQCVLL